MEMIMTLTRKGYKTRIIDEKIADLLRVFGAVSIEGPRWCGKTWTSLNHANSAVFLTDPVDGGRARDIAEYSPSLVLAGDEPIAIDEWQETPSIWDAVRHEVDASERKGRFLLTGSVTAPFTEVMHSGIGRIARVRMFPMTLYEFGLSSGTVSLADMFDGAMIEPHIAEMHIDALIDTVCAGGWPANISLNQKDAAKTARYYVDSLSDSEIRTPGPMITKPAMFVDLIRAIARSNATVVSNKTLQDDVMAGNETFNKETLASYLDYLKSLFVLTEIPGWHPRFLSKTRLRSSPKRMFIDPSLAIAALGLDKDAMLRSPATFGRMFECLCLRDLLVYADAIDGKLYHYRDNSGLEADAIVELRDGRWGALEIKLNSKHASDAARTLLALSKKMTQRNVARPSFLAVVTSGGIVRKRDDGVYEVPINCIKP
jgi:predicted AAA+ superfamily ATPase